VIINPARQYWTARFSQGAERSSAVKPGDLTIFIVDDDQSVLRSVKRLMRSAGYRNIETFASAEEFLSGAVLKEPNLLILDLLWPGMGGIDLYRHLRNQGRMTVGFALVAWPVRYAETGVMTLIINHEGQIYEKNLGPGTDAVVRRMTLFDPDPSWRKVSP
jgi:CheY-like chemotaxis protein